MKRAVLERLAAVLVLAACICAECIPLLLVLVAAAGLCVGLANSQAIANLSRKKRPPVLQHQAAQREKKNWSALILEGLKEIVKYEQLHNPGPHPAKAYPARLDQPGRH